MNDVVNLRRFRKQKARDDAQKLAQANRIAFGRTKAEREATALQSELEIRRIEGHRLDGHRIEPSMKPAGSDGHD